jgi:leucyl aminopeptidase
MTDIRADAGAGVAETVVLGVGPEGPYRADLPDRLLPAAALEALDQWLSDAGDGPGPSSRPGEVRELPLPGSTPARLLLVGVGTGTPDDLRDAGATIARTARGSVLVALPGQVGDGLRALVEGIGLGDHRLRFRSGPADAPRLRTVRVLTDDTVALAAGLAHVDAVAWARDLTNTPSSTKTPDWLARQAGSVLRPLGVQVEVHDEAWLADQGFGGVLAVGAGSISPPRLIEASWRPRGSARGPHLVLVGKGITFDSGGLNLKPADGMRTMYTDMAGGAAVLGALRATAERNLPIRVTALVPAAENAVSGSSMRPSDVITHVGGRTTEINNTDAEGRLVLADALAYAVARLRPTAVIDAATLTGAMKIALGTRIAGYFSTSDELSGDLERAATASGESVWRMPLVDDYAELLHSELADAISAPGSPGAITAAWFLRPFAGDVPWAHLDIAGPARAGADTGVATRGATGYGVRLLAHWIEAAAGS